MLFERVRGRTSEGKRLAGAPRLISSALVIGAAALPLLTAEAFAVLITNRDSQDYRLILIEGTGQSSQPIKTGGVIEQVCLKGCVLRLEGTGKDTYVLEGPEIVSIEAGKVFYDGPGVAPDPRPIDASPSARKPPLRPLPRSAPVPPAPPKPGAPKP